MSLGLLKQWGEETREVAATNNDLTAPYDGNSLPNHQESHGALLDPAYSIMKSSQIRSAQCLETRVDGRAVRGDRSWDDDWGEFEQTQMDEVSDLSNLRVTKSGPPSAEPEAVIADVLDDAWEPFEEEEPAATRASLASMPHHASGRAVATTSMSQDATTTFERPTNVPPPSSLLQLLPSVFKSIHINNVAGTIAKLELASRVLLVYRTASRVVSGRALRWKRDTLLAQSVRIGQAGKSGGMKLTAVNKSETTKEDRDVEEIINDWSGYLHEFNSIVSSPSLPSPISLRDSLMLLLHQ